MLPPARGGVSQRTLRTVLVVSAPPLLDDESCLHQTAEHLTVKALVPHIMKWTPKFGARVNGTELSSLYCAS